MEFRKLANDRRSVGHFDSAKDVSEEQLREVIETAILTPSAFNLQPWRIIAVRSEEEKEKLFNLSNKQPKIKDAPYTLIIVGDRHGYKDSNPIWKIVEDSVGKEYMERARNAANFLYGSTEERKIKFAESNAGLLAMSIMYSARDLGLDTHPMSGTDFDGVAKAFGLSDEEGVVMLIALGHFDESKKLSPRGVRFGFDEIVEIK